MRVYILKVHNDSQLIVNYVANEYQAKEYKMISYIQKARELINKFQKCEVVLIPKVENSKMDALAKLATTTKDDIPSSIPIKFLSDPSINEPDPKVACPVSSASSKMDPIVEYLQKCTLPEDKLEACKIRVRFTTIPRQPPEQLTNMTGPWPFAQWGIDITGSLPRNKGQNKYAVLTVNYFTNRVKAEPLAKITE